jgi:hypothetical protein
MSLFDKARAAYEKASTSCDPADWAVFHALSAAPRAESDELLRDALPVEPPGTSGIPALPVSYVRIPRPGVQN